MQFFTTEMIFTHPPRTMAGHYASPRRRRYGCRTMPRIVAPATDARVEPRTEAPVDDASTQASACATVDTDEVRLLIIDEAA